MSTLRELMGSSGPATCFLCGSEKCDHRIQDATPVFDVWTREPVPERMYRVTEPVVRYDGEIVYNTGALISLELAVSWDLPGAVEMTTAPTEGPRRQRKPMQSAENRRAEASE